MGVIRKKDTLTPSGNTAEQITYERGSFEEELNRSMKHFAAAITLVANDDCTLFPEIFDHIVDVLYVLPAAVSEHLNREPVLVRAYDVLRRRLSEHLSFFA